MTLLEKHIFIQYSVFKSLWLSWREHEANIAEVKHYSQCQVAKYIWENNSFCDSFLVDNLCVLTSPLWSEHLPISWTCNFYQMHPLIKDNLFQSLLVFWSLNPNSDTPSCYSIKMYFMYFSNLFLFHKDLLVKIYKFANLQVADSTYPEP